LEKYVCYSEEVDGVEAEANDSEREE